MRVLYGVSGEGLGHSSRAEEVIRHLKKKGHEVLVMTYGQTLPHLKNYNAKKIDGINILYDKNLLLLGRTILYNIPWLLRNIINWNELKKNIENFNPDVCISDMEPLTPRISNSLRVPVISLDNQHILTHAHLKIPKERKKGYFVAKMTVKAAVPKARRVLILSFNKVNEVKHNARLIDPIIREEVLKFNPKKEKFALVYLSKQDFSIVETLKNLDEKFIVYGLGKKRSEGNLIFKEIGKGFLNDLKNTKAIISNAGFSLISEALYLKKPYFAIPLKGQFEQTLNALFLEREGYGVYSENPIEKEIKEFLVNLNKYEKKLKKYKINPNRALQVIDEVLEETSNKTSNIFS